MYLKDCGISCAIAHFVHCNSNIMWIHHISGSKCHYIIYLTVPHASLGCDPRSNPVYSSKVMSVLVWIVWLGRDLIVYSEVLCFQVTLALLGSAVSGLDVNCVRQSNNTAAKNKSNLFAVLKNLNSKMDNTCRRRTQKNRRNLSIYVSH